MASAAIQCTVVSPERPLFDGEATRLVAPGWDGEIGVYPAHAPLVAKLGAGVMRLHRDDGGVTTFATRGGFMRVSNDTVTLLVQEAVKPEDIDERQAKQELEEVIAMLQHPSSEEEFEELLWRRRWLSVCLSLYDSDKFASAKRSLSSTSAG